MSHETPEPAPSDNEQPTAAPESAEAAPAEAAPAAEENTIDKLQAEVARYKDIALRTQADFDNYRKRAAREREDAIKSANASLLTRLLPVIDNFELGLQHARNEGSEGVVVGFDMVGRQLSDFLSGSGVEVIDAEGQEFDHNLHDALGQEESDTVPEGHIVRQVRKGYKMKDRLIRAANVFVSKGKP